MTGKTTMSIGLHKNCLQCLSEKIAEQLPKINVQNKMFLERWSTIYLRQADSSLPQNGSIKAKLEEYVSETPVSDFAYETLSKELHQGQKYDSKTAEISLTQLDDYKDQKAVAERLVRDFESLPWKYSLAVKLDNQFGTLFAKTVKESLISDSLKIITPDEAFATKFPAPSVDRAQEQGLGSLLQHTNTSLTRSELPPTDHENHLSGAHPECGRKFVLCLLYFG